LLFATHHLAGVEIIPMQLDLTILRLDAAGDGATLAPDGATLHIPRTLPGKNILATKSGAQRAVCNELLLASPQRIAPACQHFADCGGCAVQHLEDAPYAEWKRGLVVHALTRAGFDASVVGPLVRTMPRTRRRMDFAARRVPGGVLLGLHTQNSGTIVDIIECPVLHPKLVALLNPLRTLLRTLNALRTACDVVANLYDDGPDLLLRLDAAPNATDRAKFAAFAESHGVARIACAVGNGSPEVAALLRTPTIRFANIAVAPPPGAFLQASAEAEASIVTAVLAGLPRRLRPRAHIIELFAGNGTLTFPLAAHARVQAFEGHAESAAALRRAAGGTRIEAIHRDLTRQPLQPADLAGAAAIVLDPPFAGAAPQMPPLAAARIPTIIYVSCNPAALARDAAALHLAGYKLAVATPIDQFLWSAQVEAVCVFRTAA
jgi:23S rRNA (uracil1939-C5)-methyltransferase